MWHLLEQIRRQQIVQDKLWEAYLMALHDAWNELEKDRDKLLVEVEALKATQKG
jgi:hypothetical protein